MTLEEIKDQVANDNGWQTWDKATPPWVEPKEVERLMNEVAQRYEQSQTQELKEQKRELVEMLEQAKEKLYGCQDPATSTTMLAREIEELITKHKHLKSNTDGK